MSADPRAVLTRAAPPPDATVAYGSLPDQVMDLRLPARPAAWPPVVVIHGGFWRAAYDRAHIAGLSAALAAAGWAVATIEYRRTGAPGGGWPGTFTDVATAVAAAPAALVALARMAGTAGTAGMAARIDSPGPPGPPLLVGHSAGGQLALWQAVRAPDTARGVLALAPVADLADAYHLDLDGGAVAALLGGGPADVPDRYAAVDPMRLGPPAQPVVVLHGDQDRQVPIDASRRYVAAANAAGGRLRLAELAGIEHFGLIDPCSKVWPVVRDELRSLSGKVSGD